MAFKVGTSVSASGEVIIDDQRAGYFENTTGDWPNAYRNMAWKYRQIINYAYVFGGYHNSAAWKDVGKTVAATDQTSHLGSLLDYSAQYNDGVCNQTSEFIFGTGPDDIYHGPLLDFSTHTSAFNMYNDSMLTHSTNFDPIYDINDTGIIFQETYFAWICGGHNLGASAWGNPAYADSMRFDMTNETVLSGKLTGTVTWDGTNYQGSVYAVSDETQGFIGFSTYGTSSGSGWSYSISQENVTDQTVVYATETVLNTSNNICFCPHQHGISTKEHKAYGSNEGHYQHGWYHRVWNLTTMTQTDTVQKPWYVEYGTSENNFTMGQDHQYMLGCYGDNGAGSSVQQNTSWRLNHSTDTGPVDPSGLAPTWQTGIASGTCGWRA